MWQKILVGIGLDATQFEAGAKRVESVTTRLAGSLSGKMKVAMAGAFSAAAITSFAKSAVDAANRIKDLADQSGLTTDQVQQLDFAAKQAGSSFDALSGKLDKMGQSRRDAMEGNAKMAASFAKLGISMEDVADQSKSNVELFSMMARGSGDRMALGDVFGKGGGQFAAVLETLKQSDGDGVFFTSADIDAIDTLSETVDKLVSRGQGFFAGILAKTATSIDSTLEDIGPRKAAIERMRDQFGTGGMLRRVLNPFDSTFQDEIAKSRDLDKSSLTESPRRMSIADQRNALLAEMSGGIFAQGGGSNALLTNAQREAAINEQVAEIAMKADEKRRAAIAAVNPRLDGFSADSLARMGGFVGGAGAVDPSISIATEGNRILRQIERHLEEIRQDTRDGGNGINGEFAP